VAWGDDRAGTRNVARSNLDLAVLAPAGDKNHLTTEGVAAASAARHRIKAGNCPPARVQAGRRRRMVRPCGRPRSPARAGSGRAWMAAEPSQSGLVIDMTKPPFPSRFVRNASMVRMKAFKGALPDADGERRRLQLRRRLRSRVIAVPASGDIAGTPSGNGYWVLSDTTTLNVGDPRIGASSSLWTPVRSSQPCHRPLSRRGRRPPPPEKETTRHDRHL